LVILGSGGVGKSAITIQFLQNHFIEIYDPTIEDAYRKQIIVDKKCYFLEILDTAGQEEYAAMRHMYMREGDGFIIVYDVSKMSSFNHVESIRENILLGKDYKPIPLVLCGNKTDLHYKRQVSYHEGYLLAQKLKCKFIECSAKEAYNIEELWFTLIREIECLRTLKPKLKIYSKCLIL
jgi:GTPase KRas protein